MYRCAHIGSTDPVYSCPLAQGTYTHLLYHFMSAPIYFHFLLSAWVAQYTANDDWIIFITRWPVTAQRPVRQERRRRSLRETMTARSECLSSIRPNELHSNMPRDWRGCTDSPQGNTSTDTCCAVCVYACMHECMYVQCVLVPLVCYLLFVSRLVKQTF